MGSEQLRYTSDVIYGASLKMDGFSSDGTGAFESDPERGESVLTAGSTQSLSLLRPVVDTGNSFTVAVWVRIDDPTKPSMVVRQAGDYQDSWRLEYRPSAGSSSSWIFSMNASDTPSGVPFETAAATDRVTAHDNWTLLVGTYDASTRKMSILIRDRLRDDAGLITPLRDGRTVIGRVPGSSGAGMSGLLDDLRVYSGVKPAQEICVELLEMEAASCGQ